MPFLLHLSRCTAGIALLVVTAGPAVHAQQPQRRLSANNAPFAWSKPISRKTSPAAEPSSSPGAWETAAPPSLDAFRWEARAAVDRQAPIQPATDPSWHKQYTLGPGDSLNFSMFDRGDLARLAVPIAPDGTISYLQAVGVKAIGLTIPELRRAIEQALGEKYHRNPKVIVTPAIIGSKRFSIIGRVREPGSFLLDRPTTILEGLAASKGIEVGYIGSSSFELADLDRSFVVRHGRKLDVNLADLYFRGKLSENAYLEPGDYIYIASSLRNEVYVIGAVNQPGRIKIATPLTVTRAITLAGGYDRTAYKGRVLLIRGSIHKPDVYVVDVGAILHGRSPDFALQNRDIIFVDTRPFQMAEKALDSAIFTYVQTISSEVINDAYLDLSIPAKGSSSP